MTTGLVGVVALPPPHPVITAMAASSRSGSANAGRNAFFEQLAKRCLVSANLVFVRKSRANNETAGNSQITGGVFLLTGKENTEAFAVVLTVTGTLIEDPAVTVIGEEGPLHAA